MVLPFSLVLFLKMGYTYQTMSLQMVLHMERQVGSSLASLGADQ